MGVPLVGILHETLGAEEFKSFFKGDLFLDEEKRFYGPKERRMLITGFLRWSVYQQIFATKSKNVDGNLKGDGTLLGGVFVLGKKGQGVIYEHREGYFGDHCNITEVMEAVNAISGQNK